MNIQEFIAPTTLKEEIIKGEVESVKHLVKVIEV